MSKLTSFKDFARGALNKVKSSWNKLRAKLTSIITSKLKKADPGEEVRIRIPAMGSDNLISEARSGDIEAIKGNYNEALLLKMIYETTHPVIQISDKYKKNKSAIDQKVKQWDDALKKARGGDKAKPVIEQGTKAMLQYLIQTTQKADSIIVGGFLDNLSFQRGGIGTKGDIGLHIMKEGKEELQDFSLKLYGTKSVGLANSTASGLAGHLVGPKGKSEVDKLIEQDEELQIKMKAASNLNKTKEALKDYNKDDEKKKQSGLNRLKKYGFTPAQIKKLNIDKLRDERQLARTDINPRLAEIAFDVITKFQKKNPQEFNKNLLDILGFNDHDTKMLMAVTTKRGSIIIDRHPELDLNNVKLVKTGVSIKVVGPTGKTVVTFGFKEGEKKAVTGKVSYASVPIFQAESKKNPRIPRKKGQPAGSKKHSDLYTDENPRGTIHGLGFKDVKTAEASIKKIENSGKKHAHKIQAAIAMEQRARVMGKKGPAAVYRKYINKMKKITKQKNECITFDSFISEASQPGKNVHMTHIEDRVLYGGVKGGREAIFALRGLRDMLAGESSKTTDVTVKWDGAPAVFAGIDPRDGQFFVAKKGIFNKDPKVYKSHMDIDKDTSGDLSSKLKVAYDELKKLDIKGVIQGDLLFTDDVKKESIDGERYLTFQPNTIVYAVPVNSPLGKRISQSKIGIIFHTSYSGKDFESMKASYNVDVKKLKNSSSVFFDNANLKDVSGTATLTKDETAEVTQAISKAGKIFQRISSTTLKEIEQDPTLAQELETFNNTFVRKGEKIGDPKGHVKKLIKYFEDKYSKEIVKRKSPQGKEKQIEKKAQRMKFFSKSNSKNLELVFELQKQIVTAKELIISKLDKVKKMDTFVRTKNGFKVTGQEGFVAIDKIGGGVVKLVDRLEFSYNNFSPDTIKGWEK